MRRHRYFPFLVAFCALAAVPVGACSSDDAAAPSTTSPDPSVTEPSVTEPSVTESTEIEPLTVLVTNDDGVSAEGIDQLVQGLQGIDGLEIVVVAPAENQSGSGGKTTDAPLVAAEATTASGYPAMAVDGTPADSVIWAIGEGGVDPDFVVSGVNEGQNIGPAVPVSGTVGAARQAAQLGVPSLAVSQGAGDSPDYPSGVEAAVVWMNDNLGSIRAGEVGVESITSINVPTCIEGAIRGTVEVPWLPEADGDLTTSDCTSDVEPTDDVSAFLNGYISVTVLEPTGSMTQ